MQEHTFGYAFETNLNFLRMFVGIAVFQIIHMLLQWSYLRRKEYLFYIAYIVCLSSYFLLIYEPYLPIKYFTLIDPDALIHFDRALPILGYLFYFQFSRYFLEVDKNYPESGRWTKRITIAIFIYLLFELSWAFAGGDRRISEIVFLTTGTLLFITTMVYAMSLVRKGVRLITLIVFGAVVINIGSAATVICLQLIGTGVKMKVDPFIFSELGIIIDMIMFTSGLAYKSFITEREKTELIRAMQQKERDKFEMERKVQRMQSALARELHGELATSMASIRIYTELAQKEHNREQEAVYLGKVSRIAQQQADQIDDIVWAMNPQHATYGAFGNRVKQFAKEILSPLQIEMRWDCEVPEKELMTSMELVKQLSTMLRAYLLHYAGYRGELHWKIRMYRTGQTLFLELPFYPEPRIPALQALVQDGKGAFQLHQSGELLKMEVDLTKYRDSENE